MPKIEISLPTEIYQEIKTYTKAEGMSVVECEIW
jgi:hypothetical protein